MSFSVKDWRNATSSTGGGDVSTPLSAAAIEDLELRVTDYADSLAGADAGFHNIVDYGAVDGGADSTTAIQAALNAAADGSGAVFIPKGNYIATNLTYSQTDNSGPGLKIFGLGAVSQLSQKAGATGFLLAPGSTSRHYSLVLDGISFQGDSARATSSGLVQLVGTQDAQVRGCQFLSWPASGVALELKGGLTGGDAMYARVEDNLFNNYHVDGTCILLTSRSPESHPDGARIIANRANGAEIFVKVAVAPVDAAGILAADSVVIGYNNTMECQYTCQLHGASTLVIGNRFEKVSAGAMWIFLGAGTTNSPCNENMFVANSYAAVGGLSVSDSSIGGARRVNELNYRGSGNTITIASSTINLDTIGVYGHDYVEISGTGDVTTISGTSWVGRKVTMKFTGTKATNGVIANTNNIRLNATPFAYTPNDTLTLLYDGTNWLEVSRSQN